MELVIQFKLINYIFVTLIFFITKSSATCFASTIENCMFAAVTDILIRRKHPCTLQTGTFLKSSYMSKMQNDDVH